MFSRFAARTKVTARRRGVLGLAAVLWLNMAVLPCAMAFQSADLCVHCPPPDEHEPAAHHGHGADQTSPTGSTLQSECCDLEDAKADSRVNKLEAKPVSAVVFVSAPATVELPTRIAGQRHCAADPPGLRGTSPPLHVLFCVYLD